MTVLFNNDGGLALAWLLDVRKGQRLLPWTVRLSVDPGNSDCLAPSQATHPALPEIRAPYLPPTPRHPFHKSWFPACVGQPLPADLWQTCVGWFPRSREGEEPKTSHPSPAEATWATGETQEPVAWRGSPLHRLPVTLQARAGSRGALHPCLLAPWGLCAGSRSLGWGAGILQGASLCPRQP